MAMTRILLSFMLSLSTIKAAESILTMSSHYCSDSTTFTPNSTYHANLNHVLDDLVNDTNADKGFLFTSSGTSSSEAVYGSFMCKGDVSKKECMECVKNARLEITLVCRMTKVSILWYSKCMLRYSDTNFTGIVETKPRLSGYNEENIEKPDQFMMLLKVTMDAAIEAAQHPPRMYGHREAKFTQRKKLYTFAQCVPYLSKNYCSQCLLNATSRLLSLPKGKIGGQVLLPSCFVRFEIYPFHHRRSSKVRRQISDLHSQQFHLQTIEAATNKFSDDNKLGEGGFGPVYKGTLPGGQEIAAKRLSRISGQGIEEFKTEIELLPKLQDRNLVRLLGFSMERDETILVYEYVSKGSLDHLLFDPELGGQLDWSARYKVMVGVARGLLYLHENSRLRIIHRDLKPSNILLDADMNPKISDFGLARIFDTNQNQASTSRIVGTYGYMSPEYLMFGQFSIKSDVFSYGVLMLEIITGKKNSRFSSLDYDEGLIGYVWKNWMNRTPSEVVDAALINAYSMNEVIRCMHIGLLCVQDDPEDRPTMDLVVLMLSSGSISIPVPQRPSFFSPCKKYKRTPCVLNSDQSTCKANHSNSKIKSPWSGTE
ncbi:hypothetical protein EUGRSUZ_D00828, partial [Eucalyptus grandis]